MKVRGLMDVRWWLLATRGLEMIGGNDSWDVRGRAGFVGF
jgi:hypothetical protein